LAARELLAEAPQPPGDLFRIPLLAVKSKEEYVS
jgi:hypothetical protein